MVVAYLLCTLASLNLAYLALQVAVLRAFAIDCDEATFGIGPRLSTFSLAGTRWVIKPLPVSSHVLPHGMEGGVLVGSPRATLCAVYALPWLVLVAAIAAVAGVEPTTQWGVSAVPQLLSPVYPELGGSAPLVRRLAELLRSQPVTAGLAVATKLCVFNLLPLPNLAGGRVVLELLPITTRARSVAATLAMWLTLALMLAWAWAFCWHFR